MASSIYPLARQAFLSGSINLGSDTIKVMLLGSAYTYSGSHQFQSDLSGTIQASGALGGISVTNGTFNANPVTLSAVTTGQTITALAGYKDTGTPTTSPLIWFMDGFSQLTNGGAIVVTWDTGSNKIFVI